MAARKLFMALVLAVLSAGTGCQGWCNRHYPCPAPAPYPAYAPAACPPAYTPPPVVAAPRTMQGCTCTCP